MALTYDAMVALHQELVFMFTKKLAQIPKHSFFGDRKPTLDDYYKLNNAALPDHIPRSLSLPFFLQNYSIFASNEFSSYAFVLPPPLQCIDQLPTRGYRRSLASGNKNKEMMEFIYKFRLAFVAYNLRLPDFEEQADFLSFWYYNTKYDLIKFPSRSIKKILAKVNEVKNEVPSQMPFKPAEFLDKARLQDRAHSSQFAFIWAVQWLVDIENRFNYVEDLEKGYSALPNVFQDDMSASLAGMRMNDDLPNYLTQEHLTRTETQALLKEIEEVEPVEEKYSVMWMDPKVAADRILDSDLSAMLQNIKL